MSLGTSGLALRTVPEAAERAIYGTQRRPGPINGYKEWRGSNGRFKTELDLESGELHVCSRCQWLHCCVRIRIV